MPEPSQFLFTHNELTEMMIKRAGLHEGKWMLMVSFAFAAINGGPSADQVMPSAIAGVQNIGIQKAQIDSPLGLVVDAAEVNPVGQNLAVKEKSKGKRG